MCEIISLWGLSVFAPDVQLLSFASEVSIVSLILDSESKVTGRGNKPHHVGVQDVYDVTHVRIKLDQ